jgi:hypothetical protein
MADNAEGGFLGRIRGNAEWDAVKAVAGGLVNSLSSGITEYLRHRSVDWWGLVVLGIVTAIFVWFILRTKNCAKTEAAIGIAASDSHLVIKVDPCVGLFTLLQIEAFQFAHDIEEFLKGVEPIPKTSHLDTQEENISKLKDIFAQRDKLDSAFKLRFEERGTKLERRFKEIRNPISHLPIHEIHSRNISKEGISLYTASIVAATHRIDGVMLEAKAP